MIYEIAAGQGNYRLFAVMAIGSPQLLMSSYDNFRFSVMMIKSGDSLRRGCAHCWSCGQVKMVILASDIIIGLWSVCCYWPSDSDSGKSTLSLT